MSDTQTAAPQPDLSAVVAMMAQMMQQMQAQQSEIATMQRMQAQAQIDALNRADQAKADAAGAAALAASHRHSAWWDVAHIAIALAPVAATAYSINAGGPMQGKGLAYYQLGTGLLNGMLNQPPKP
jgi:hypothetical protein